ncbi:DUF4249 domain-containing protein [Fibrella forsythiae]|uniref:DUF4249 domain-containing protein n=1 Tax=Fibrella forsythiae TaxID=2817061 RepID=A0ABS3JCS1_9BACT|nr:DUF4249 domain-containing protein [Fibrella forsythiae]MBO0947799.1 DUF4249 domain-containing protein [Fibrella forsythiae]
MKTFNFRRWALSGVVLLLIGSCVDPYRPPQIEAPNRYLVVDGFLNGGTGTSTITLSRTQNLSTTGKPLAEAKATISVEGTTGEKFSFVESAAGTYTLAGTTLPVGKSYRVRIRTQAGGEYLSDPIIIKQTPKIDSLSWEVKNDGLQIYVNTHDATNKTRYYRWEYEDTYEIRTPFESPFDYVNGRVIDRVSPPVNHCWRTQTSTSINLGNTARLTQDVLQRAPLLFIPGSSPKLWIKYSLMVKQYAHSQEAYAYWENLQKTTEQLGSLFDPLPSQIGGNMHSVTNPTEPVLGFLDGYTTDQVRVFINRPLELSYNLLRTGYEYCTLDTIPTPGVQQPPPLSALLSPGGGYIAIKELKPNVQYLATGTHCADCRDVGTTTRPSFWPQ